MTDLENSRKTNGINKMLSVFFFVRIHCYDKVILRLTMFRTCSISKRSRYYISPKLACV